MRKFMVALLLVVVLPALAAGEYVSVGATAEPVSVRVLESSPSRTVLEFALGGFERTPVEIGGETYYVLSVGEGGRTLEAGFPEVPTVARSVIIADDGEMAVRVVEVETREYAGMRVAPSKGNLLRSVDPATVPYELGSVYGDGGVYPAEAAYGREPYVMRDYRGLTVVFQPFRYDAGREVLEVHERMVVVVERVGAGGVNVLTHRPSRLSAEFDRMYRSHFVNYEESRLRYAPVDEAGGMLVISYGDFMAAMEPFVEWKRQTGMACEMVSVAAAGGTAAAIRTYIQGYYSTHDLTYVLLVGDAAECPTLYANGGASDATYSLVSGGDSYPEIFVGRFSAETVAQVETQVLRTVEYEKLPFAGGEWYRKGTGIASSQGPGDDGEYDYQHVGYIRNDLLGFTYTHVDEIYDPGASAATVTAALNDGRSIINYTGHGSTMGWTTTGFSNSSVNALLNDNMLPFIVSVACYNGRFDGYTCFAEVWLRASHAGEPIGGIGTYMSSISQSWDPPMDAQDEATDLLVGTSLFGIKRTFGGLCFNGSCHMIDEYGSVGAEEFANWIIFGDPSVRVRTDSPVPLSVDHDAEVDPNATEFDVTVDGVADARCALYADGVIYGAGTTDALGHTAIPLAPPLPSELDLTLSVTSFNSVPYMAVVHVGEVHTPLLSVAPESFDISLERNATAVETLTVSNIGEALSVLSFSVEVRDRESSTRMETCSLSAAPGTYTPGATADYVLTIANSGDGDAWVNGAAIEVPVGVSVVFASNFDTGRRSLAWDGPAGDGARMIWKGDWWNVVYPGETATATVTLAVDASFEGELEVGYALEAVGRAGEDQVVYGTIALADEGGPLLTVTSPNGGEVWAADRAHVIAWTSQGSAPFVAIAWSCDGGGTWESIEALTPNDGEYAWTTPGSASSGCLVRVSLPDGTDYDTSDGAFTTITPVTWLDVTPTSGDVEAGEELPLALTLDAAGLPDGDYFADIVIESNGGDAAVPVTLRIRPTGVDERIPRTPMLYGGYPNPFNPSTRVAFSVPGTQRVRLTIYDLAGRVVRVLADSVFGPGSHAVTWDGTGREGARAASGVYFCRLESAGVVEGAKPTLTK